MSLPTWLTEIVRCPACRGELRTGPDQFVCLAADCGLQYPVVDGIPVLLVSDAVPPADRDEHGPR